MSDFISMLSRVPFYAAEQWLANLAAKIRQLGMYTFVRWSYIFIAPPLIVTKEQIDEGIKIISEALTIADEACK